MVVSGNPSPLGIFQSYRIRELAMTAELQKLLEDAKNVVVSSEQEEEQRRSFAFGNTNIENARITRETIDKEAEALKEK